MDETLWHKFTQHRDLREELLATGDAELVEVRAVPSDDVIWLTSTRIRIRTPFGVLGPMAVVAMS